MVGDDDAVSKWKDYYVPTQDVWINQLYNYHVLKFVNYLCIHIGHPTRYGAASEVRGALWSKEACSCCHNNRCI